MKSVFVTTSDQFTNPIVHLPSPSDATELGTSRVGGRMENDRLWRCFDLRTRLMNAPVANPIEREAWFVAVGRELSTIADAMELRDWMQFFAEALEEKHGGVNRDLCYYLIQERVREAQRGGRMNFTNCTPNHRLVPIAASGTAEELLGADDEFIPKQYADYDRRVLMVALILGAVLLGVAFWPAILGWMTPFKYGVLAGAIGMVALLIGGLAVGVCLGAGRLEKSK